MSAALLAILMMIAPRPSAVEVVTPKPPTVVLADGKRVLVYELHLTNLGLVPLRLTRIEVAPIGAVFTGEALANMLRLTGAGKDENPAQLDVGRRVIAFMWIALPPGAPDPTALRHRLTFDITNASAEPKESVLDGITVPVLHDAPPVLTPPFRNGDWLAGSGPSNTSDHRRTAVALEGRTWLSQRFAIDWVKVGPNGDTWHDSRERNENFWAFGEPVHAVADGAVTKVVDDYEDNAPGRIPPVTVESLAGNHVIIEIAPGLFATFAHLRHGSIRVKPHQRVRRGEVIAEVGNSGNTTGAHLHFQVTDGNSALASEGLPFVFDRFTFIGNGADFEESHHPSVPRRNEMPTENIVVHFE